MPQFIYVVLTRITLGTIWRISFSVIGSTGEDLAYRGMNDGPLETWSKSDSG
jgi:hypothetical protein